MAGRELTGAATSSGTQRTRGVCQSAGAELDGGCRAGRAMEWGVFPEYVLDPLLLKRREFFLLSVLVDADGRRSTRQHRPVPPGVPSTRHGASRPLIFRPRLTGRRRAFEEQIGSRRPRRAKAHARGLPVSACASEWSDGMPLVLSGCATFGGKCSEEGPQSVAGAAHLRRRGACRECSPWYGGTTPSVPTMAVSVRWSHCPR